MKKLDPFSGIPAVPTSIAGQWLAFSHMANHYRKLLNVKPRVNSSLPLKTPSSTRMISNPTLSSYLKQGDLVLSKKSSAFLKTTPTPPSQQMLLTPSTYNPRKVLKKSAPRPPELLVSRQAQEYAGITTSTEESSPRSPEVNGNGNLNPKTRGVNKSIKVKKRSNKETNTLLESQPGSYQNQVLFGPSSIKSSTDVALLSDCDYSSQSQSQPEELRVELETMGVAEKIKVFLNNLHHFDSNPIRTSRPKTTINLKTNKSISEKELGTCGRCGSNKKSAEMEAPPPSAPGMTTRESRHANCFIPVSHSPMGTPKKSLKKSSTPASTPGTVRKMTIPLSEAISKSKTTKSKLGTTKTSTSESKKRIVGGGGGESGAGVRTGNERRRCLSGASTGSVGTIRGSEQLTREIVLMTPNNREGHMEADYATTIMDRDQDHVPTRDRPIQRRDRLRNSSRTRTPSAGYSSLMSSTATATGSRRATATSMSNVGGIIKVPAVPVPKNNKDSSRDSAYGFSSGESRITTRESTPEKLARAGASKKVSNTSGKRSGGGARHKTALSTVASSTNFETVDKEKTKSRKSKLTTGDKYLNFLTEVTEDIVSRGIYTNRGLKMLFKDHLTRHKELDVDRMTEMLEKLRMDLGIPKDDTLNKLEFGYGTVLNSSPRSGGGYSSFNKPTTTTTTTSHPRRSGGLDASFNDDFLPPPQPNSSQNHFFIPERDSESEIELHSCKSETSLSESELQRTLKEVGVDSKTTLEIVSMIRHNPVDSFPNSGMRARRGQGHSGVEVDSIGESSVDDEAEVNANNSGQKSVQHGTTGRRTSVNGSMSNSTPPTTSQGSITS